MNLRRKLAITFGALALLGLVITGVSVWATLQWESTSEQLQGHYTRSLQADRIRAATFRAVKEVPDAVTGGDQDARQEFEEAIEPVDEDFEVWADLADTEDEQQQVEETRAAYDGVMEDAGAIFDLVDDGRQEEAIELTEGPLEEGSFRVFEETTEEAVASDREKREVVRAQVEDVRQTAQLVLVIAAFGTVSLLLLLAAYLASDLFRPLREGERALGDVEKGELARRLDEERADELGAVSRAFNRMVEAISQREALGALSTAPSDSGDDDGSTAWRNAPSRLTLHRLASQLRSKIVQLGDDSANNGSSDDQHELIGQLDRLSQAVTRVTEFGFPLDLNVSRTDVRALLYRVFMRFQDEFAERAVSIELEIAPDVDHAVVDRMKLREAVGELLGNALAALPGHGGRLGLRSRLSEDGTELLIEVADEGEGAEQSLIDEAFDPTDLDDQPRVGLALTKAVVEQHGGSLEVDSELGGGTYAQIRLPLRD